jgi:anti-sigma regulatory factor (Ser/Thr protein kinase)
MRPLASAGPREDVLDVLVRAGRLLAGSHEIADSLAQIAQLCCTFAEYCSIHVSIEAVERDEFTVGAGARPDSPVDPRGKIVQPFAAGGRRVSGTMLCETSAAKGFDDAARRAVHVLSLQLAIVILGHATTLREHRVAGRFARALLPERLPSVAGVEFHAAYRPARNEADVGGDWYDAFALPDGRIAISVGSVAERGLDAAAFIGGIRQGVRTAAASGRSTPARLLENLNEVVRLRKPVAMVTAVFGIYEPATSVLTYAVAGHPPPILALSGKVVRRLPTGGLPLGCASQLDTSDRTFTVPEGARVVFYTDGLIENNRNLIAGEERLLDVVASLDGELDPAAAVQERMFGSASNKGDATVLSLTRTGPVPRYVFSALPVVAPLARAIVDRDIHSLAISAERRFGVLVAVGEAIANAVEHAYLGEAPGLIRMRVEPGVRELVVTIEDFGRWRPFVAREERGRGIELMRAFMDGVQVRSTRESTAIVLKADLIASGAGATTRNAMLRSD